MIILSSEHCRKHAVVTCIILVKTSASASENLVPNKLTCKGQICTREEITKLMFRASVHGALIPQQITVLM